VERSTICGGIPSTASLALSGGYADFHAGVNFALTEFYEVGKAPVHYLQALASEGSQKGTFPIGSAKALTLRLTICLGQNDSHAKESRAVLI
jgi:hypothetical protein